MTSTVAEAIESISAHLAYSPATAFNKSVQLCSEAISGDLDVIDPNNPFINLLEVGAIQVAGLAARMDLQTRKKFPRLAQEITDLYPHMTDSDYLDLFATPVRQHIISFGIAVSQITANAIYNDTAAMYEMDIPRDTVITANGYSFMFNQTIIISVYQNGDIIAYFDDSQSADIVTRESNSIDTHIETYDGTSMFFMDIPCDQMAIQTVSETISASNAWNQTITFTNSFYYARGYYSQDDGTSWTEMHTVFNGNYYDPSEPTMVITVGDGKVQALIPDVYIQNSQVGTTARVDIYTTQGAQTIDLSNVASSDYKMVYNDFSNLSADYIGAIQAVSTIVVYSTASTTGGADAMTFEEIRDKVIYSGYGKQGAYNLAELKEKMTELGYSTYLQQDDLTNRIYVASRAPDTATAIAAAGLSSGISVVNEPIQFVPALNETTYAMTVNDSENRTTISPKMLYTESGGTVTMVNDTDWAAFNALEDDAQVAELNANNYFWSPLHTILDYDNSAFVARCYWMTNPSNTYINVKATNSGVGFSALVSDVSIEYNDDNYVVTVQCERPTDTDGFVGQLVYTDSDGTLWRWNASNSNLTDDTMDFVFTISTSYDIDSDHTFDSDGTDNDGNQGVRLPIAPTFTFLLLIESDSQTASSFDNLIYMDDGNTYSGVTYETMKIVFGYYMQYMNLVPRPILTNTVYETYADNVYDTYPSTVYVTDEDGVPTLTETDGVYSLTVLHEAGDQKVDDDGNPIVLHAKGEKKVNESTGAYVVSQSSVYGREVKLPIFDARFRFATTDLMETFTATIPSQIYQYLSTDITNMQSSLFENTKLYFEPTVTHKSTSVRLSSTKTTTMQTAISFTFTIQLTESAYNDNDFRSTLIDSATAAVVDVLASTTVSVMDIISAIQALAPTRILNVTVENEPLGDTGVAEIEDNASKFTLAKTMVLQANGLKTIEEDINFGFTY